MLRRTIVLITALLAVAGCSDCGAPRCKSGVTFYISALTGSLSPGTEEPLTICFDGACKDVTVSREATGPTMFLEFKGVADNGDHTITVAGVGSLQGEYTGPLAVFTQKPNGKSCASCSLAAVKIGADGTLTPGTAVTPDTTPATAASGG